VSEVVLCVKLQARYKERSLGGGGGLACADEEEDALSDGSEAEGAAVDALRKSVLLELKCFRRSEMLPAQGCVVDPLRWWKERGSCFPLLAEMARVVLAVPGSRIECQRVFSLAGAATMQLRASMPREEMESRVFIAKNLDVGRKLRELLGTWHGAGAFETVADELLAPVDEGTAAAAAVATSADGSLCWDVVDELLEGAEPMFAEAGLGE
jgi:hypothetical protein